METLIEQFRSGSDNYFKNRSSKNHYPHHLKTIALKCLDEGERNGVAFSRLAADLGIRGATLENWRNRRDTSRKKPSTSFARVTIESPRKNLIRIQTSKGFFAEFESEESAAKFFRLLVG
tara:strand:+ start:76 stop:435 length:360 start_codon:yes stop_codon:yes gene_type:complete